MLLRYYRVAVVIVGTGSRTATQVLVNMIVALTAFALVDNSLWRGGRFGDQGWTATARGDSFGADFFQGYRLPLSLEFTAARNKDRLLRSVLIVDLHLGHFL